MTIQLLPAWAIDKGDLLDLQDDEIADPNRNNNEMLMEFARVTHVEREGKPGAQFYKISTTQGSFTFPLDHELLWCGHGEPPDVIDREYRDADGMKRLRSHKRTLCEGGTE